MNKKAENHPEKETLVAFGLGKLDLDQAKQIEEHLEHCSDCCDTVVELNLKEDTFVSLVRKSPAPNEGPQTEAGATSDVVASGSSESTDLPIQATVDVQSGATGVVTKFADLPRELREHPRYEILELIGRGGMGDVYKAQHKVMNRLVALKVIKPELVRNEAAVSRFRREVQAAAQLHHNNIVTAHDAEQAGNLHFLVMEYVDGVDLDEVIRDRGPLPVEEACDYIRQVAEGLQHAYERGMVHRDIKPHNLMAARLSNADCQLPIEEEQPKDTKSEIANRESAIVKILDFGLAKFATETAELELGGAEDAAKRDQQYSESTVPGASILNQLTQMGTMMGTPDYIAPEQAEDAHTADIRADIYSLGCTFYTLLSGRAPFGEGSVLDKVRAHSEKDATPISDLRDDVPAEVQAVLQKMMAIDPAERYQTPAEVAVALGASCQLADSAPKNRKAESSSPRKRRPLILTAVATLFLAIVAGIGIYIATDNGTLVIKTEAPNARILVKQNGKEIKTVDVQQYIKADETHLAEFENGVRIHVDLRSGDYEIELLDGGTLKLSKSQVRIRRGHSDSIRITRQPQEEPAQTPPQSEVVALLKDATLVMNFASETVHRADKLSVRDLSGNENHGVCGEQVVRSPAGRAGSGLSLQGDTMKIPNLKLHGAQDYTIAFWVYDNGGSEMFPGRTLIRESLIKPDGKATSNLEVAIDDGRVWWQPGWTSRQSIPIKSPGGPVSVGQWFFVALTSKITDTERELRITINDQTWPSRQLVMMHKSKVPEDRPRRQAEGFLEVGGLNGKIDELVILPRSLTEQHLNVLYRYGRAGKPLPMIAPTPQANGDDALIQLD